MNSTLRLRRGFTLIELLIAVAVIAILTTIAVPSYSSYITRSAVKTAQVDLLTLGLTMEGAFLQSLKYPDATTSTAETTAALPGWRPVKSDEFNYTITASGTSNYTLQAVGTSSRTSGYVISLDSTNLRQLTNPAGAVTSW